MIVLIGKFLVHMPSLQDLPLDILHHELFPLLDYNSRITLNKLLPPQERKTKALLQEALDTLQYNITIGKVKKFLDYIDAHGLYFINKNIKDFDTNILVALQFNTDIRLRTIDSLQRLVKYIDNRASGTEFVTPYIKKKVKLFASTLIYTINTKFPIKETLVNLDKEIRPVSDIEDVITVIKMPIKDPFLDSMDLMDKIIEKQLRIGRRMMAFWKTRGDFN
jgi:hypothetical protein